jgi:hypothetical protein
MAWVTAAWRAALGDIVMARDNDPASATEAPDHTTTRSATSTITPRSATRTLAGAAPRSGEVSSTAIASTNPSAQAQRSAIAVTSSTSAADALLAVAANAAPDAEVA